MELESISETSKTSIKCGYVSGKRKRHEIPNRPRRTLREPRRLGYLSNFGQKTINSTTNKFRGLNDISISGICNICKTWVKRSNRNNHMEMHEKEFVCVKYKCRKKFKTKYGLSRHVKKVHIEKRPCEKCGKELKDVNSHIKRMHPDENLQDPATKTRNKNCAKYKCKYMYCDKYFKLKRTLIQHQKICKTKKNSRMKFTDKTLHPIENKINEKLEINQPNEYQIEEMRQPDQIGYPSNEEIPPVNELVENGMIETLTPAEDRIICLICDVVFSNEGELQKHGRTHGAPVVVICPTCDQKFYSPEELEEHKINYHVWE